MLDLKGNRITYFGHSTFSLTTPSGQVALIDPWVMTNPRCPESLKKVPKLDAIFLSHAHGDHFGDLLDNLTIQASLRLEYIVFGYVESRTILLLLHIKCLTHRFTPMLADF